MWEDTLIAYNYLLRQLTTTAQIHPKLQQKMNLEQFLQNESNTRKFPWKDISEWTPEKLRTAWEMTGKSIVGNDKYRDLNPSLTDDLIFYLLRDERFSKDLNKGILLFGPNGTGKSKYIQTLTTLLKFLHGVPTPTYTGKQMEFILRLPQENEKVLTLWDDVLGMSFDFEDIGEENPKVKTMGTDISIGVEILGALHLGFERKGALSFGTTNLTSKQIELRYGARISSRVNEMFNGFALEGDDLRRLK